MPPEKKETGEEATALLRRQLLLFYLRHPVGLKVIKSWFADAGAGKMGPGDLLDHKYPAHFKIFREQCANASRLSSALRPHSYERTRSAFINEVTINGEVSILPKDAMLISLGAYLQTQKRSFSKYKTKSCLMRLTHRLGILTNRTAQPELVLDVATRLKSTRLQPVTLLQIADQAMKSRFGHPIMLADCPIMKKFDNLRKRAMEKDLKTRTNLYIFASSLGYSRPHAIKVMDEFLSGKITSRSKKSLNKLTPFARQVSDYLGVAPEILYAGEYPVCLSISPRENGRKSSAPRPC